MQDNVFLAGELIVKSNKDTIDLSKRVRLKLIGRGTNVSRIKITCQADPALLEFKRVIWSDWLLDQKDKILQNNDDPGTWVGEIQLEEATDSLVVGELIGTLVYKGVGTGTTDITCEPEFTDPDGNPIPAGNTPHTVTIQ